MADDSAPQPPALRDHVYSQMRSWLVERRYQPGEHLPELAIASELRVSRGPVREALQKLARDGWLELMPRRGAFVRLPDREEIRQFFEMRMLLEGESARLAALRNSHRAYALLNPLLSEAESLLGVAEYLPKLSSMTPDFHRRITDLADNNILVAFTAQMADRTEWFARPSMATIAKQAWAEHRGIANAVEAGDSDRAADLAREHVRWAQEVYEEHNREQP